VKFKTKLGVASPALIPRCALIKGAKVVLLEHQASHKWPFYTRMCEKKKKKMIAELSQLLKKLLLTQFLGK